MSDRKGTPRKTTADFSDRMQREMRGFLCRLDRPDGLALLDGLRRIIDAESAAICEVERSRQALIEGIAVAQDYAELRSLEEDLTRQEIERFEYNPSVLALHRGCTEYRDLLAARTMELVAAEMVSNGAGEAPLPYALISMGSDGRAEQTLITDQDYLLVYGDGGGEAEDLWFATFSEILVERLAEVGFKKCTGEIMPSNPIWRGSVHQWSRRLLAIVRYEFEEYAKNLMDLIVLSDARYVAGDRQMADALVELIRDFESNYFQVIWGMAKAATEMKVGLAWFGRLWTDRSGEHRGLFNIKLLGWAPLVMNVRILAVNSGVTETNTLQRLERLYELKSLTAATTEALRDAYLLLTRHRIRLQIAALRSAHADSYYLDPNDLTRDEVDALRQALIQIEDLQKVIRSNFTIV